PLARCARLSPAGAAEADARHRRLLARAERGGAREPHATRSPAVGGTLRRAQLVPHAAVDAQHVRSRRPRRDARLVESRAPDVVPVRSVSRRSRFRRAGLRAARRARTGRVRALARLSVRGGMPVLRRSADAASRPAAGPGSRSRARGAEQGRSADAARTLAVTEGRMTQPTPEWPVAFFDDDYLKIYRP